MKTLRNIALAAGTLAVVVTGTTLASPHGKEHGMKQDCAHHGEMREKMATRMQERLATVKTELKLTAAQEPAWQRFEQALRSQAGMHEKADRKTQADDPLAARIAHMEQRLAGMKQVAQARRELHKSLTPEQQTIAERLFKRHRGPNV